MEKIQNTISNRVQNTVFQEELIKQIVDSAIKDTLEDFKTQHKNSIVLLSHKLGNGYLTCQRASCVDGVGRG